MSGRLRNLLQIHGAVVLFGFVGLFGKLLLPLPPTVIVFGRVVFAALALLVISVSRRLPLLPRARSSLLAFAALGLLLAVHWTTFFQSVQASSVVIGQITFLTFPVFAALLEPPLFHERLRLTDVLLAFAALLGVVILVPGFELSNRTTQGVLWGVASGLTFAMLSLLNRKLVRRHASVSIALYQDAFAALALLPFVLAEQPSFTAKDVLLLLVLGVLCTAVAHSLFIAGLHGVKARTAGTISCLEPVYGAALAALFLREVPTIRTAAGGFIVGGVALWATVRAGKDELLSSSALEMDGRKPHAAEVLPKGK
jgi:drug/metabolite transporter (DMT)-like permease